jgi:hypothetical protein
VISTLEDVIYSRLSYPLAIGNKTFFLLKTSLSKNIKGTEKLLFIHPKLIVIFNSTFKVSKFFNSSTLSIKVAMTNGNFDFFFSKISSIIISAKPGR